MKHMSKYLVAFACAAIMGGCAVTSGQEGVGAYLSDSAVTANVKAKFAADQAVAASRIGVETLNGVVQLSGFAKDNAERTRAEQLARETQGVKSVKNDIRVQ